MTVKIVQNAYVVQNLEQKCQELYDQFDIGPFVLAENLELAEHRYRGRSAETVILDAAFAQSGDLNIEIIQVKSSGDNAFYDMFPTGSGFHHVAYFCDRYGEERDRLIGLGYPVASEFSIGEGIEVCYVDTRPMFGHMVELYPKDGLLLGLYEKVRNIRDSWDGQTLLLPW